MDIVVFVKGMVLLLLRSEHVAAVTDRGKGQHAR